MEIEWGVGAGRGGVTCWLVPAAAVSCRRGTRCSRHPCSGPCTWRCTSAGGENARLSSGPGRRAHPGTTGCARAGVPPRRPAGPRTRRCLPAAPAVSPVPSCPGSPPASRCTSGSTCPSSSVGTRELSRDTRPQWTPPPSAPAPAHPRTCSSSCALATAICTFTCSMMSPGSSLPPPELPKSEPKPPSMAPQSQPNRDRVRRPVPTPEVGRPGHHGKWSPGVLGTEPGRTTAPTRPCTPLRASAGRDRLPRRPRVAPTGRRRVGGTGAAERSSPTRLARRPAHACGTGGASRDRMLGRTREARANQRGSPALLLLGGGSCVIVDSGAAL